MKALVEAAAITGATLAREAYWSGERCSWVGHPVSESLPGAPRAVEPLGPGVYAGTAGVGLFLAELAAATGNAVARRTARGAFRHALARVETLHPTLRRSLYSGGLGVGWAAARAGTALGDEALVADGLALARRIAAEPEAATALDVIAGNAGAVLAFLALDRLAPDDAFTGAAIRLGDEIAAAAIRQDDTWSWPTLAAGGVDMGPRPLTGFAHGAAGMGLALLEIGVRAGRDDLRAGAEAAFRYEDAWFSAEHENWPDFREDAAQPKPPPSYGIAWCHGAPGSGLARLRALTHLPDRSALRKGAEAALRTTQGLLDRALAEPELDTDVTPCHGIAGLTEVLLWSAQALDRPELRDRAVAVWERLAACHGPTSSWPSGLPTLGRMPALMLGLSGAGHALLRTSGISPSVLLPT